MKVYFVEDEKDLAEIIKKYLYREGYEVTTFYSGEEAIAHINDPVDLWILDIMLSGNIDGYDLITRILEVNPKVPVIFTSARDQALDKIRGLELGSDDYIAKPYSPRELLLRVKAILKRKQNNSTFISYAEYRIYPDSREIKLGTEIIDLTNKEFDLLLVFLNNRQSAISREEILETIWGKDYFGSDRVVDDLLRRLRNKMTLLRIETIYGFGYRLL